MLAEILRQKYLEFFAARAHAIVRSAPLVPENDPTVLFTTAGMHPLVPFLLGEPHPRGRRLANVQKCIRTGDIDEVGDPIHLTFFEMLGNWSLGDYFKREAIEFSFAFLTGPQWLNLPVDRLAMTVFAGDADAPCDEESYAIWQELGIPTARLAKLGKKDNWWGPAGKIGPCGPDTEMFYWTGDLPTPAAFVPADPRWVEIWNDVFMEYNKTADGTYVPLAQRNVDTGMGLERVTAILQGKPSCYETELFAPLFAEIDACAGRAVSTGPRTSSERIVADHLRAAVFILADGISPGNVDQGYVLRRLIRRAVREGRRLGIAGEFTARLATTVVRTYGGIYPELNAAALMINDELQREEEQFARTLEKGTREFEKLVAAIPAQVAKKQLSGRKAFYLYETYGFPLELTEAMAAEAGFTVDRDSFDASFRQHQELSRQGAEQRFKGGLADNSESTTRLHTATHLLHQALREVLGPHVAQKGSNITAERLRFDFSHPDKLTPEQLAAVEARVNAAIARQLAIVCTEMSFVEATAAGAIGLFADRYGERVKVYRIGDYSCEVCGGPHVANLAELGHFRLLKEESSSRGVRRIKAVLEHAGTC